MGLPVPGNTTYPNIQTSLSADFFPDDDSWYLYARVQEAAAEKPKPTRCCTGSAGLSEVIRPVIAIPKAHSPRILDPEPVETELPRENSQSPNPTKRRRLSPREGSPGLGLGNIPMASARSVSEPPTSPTTEVKQLKDRVVTLEKEKAELNDALDVSRGQTDALRRHIALITRQFGELHDDLVTGNLNLGL